MNILIVEDNRDLAEKLKTLVEKIPRVQAVDTAITLHAARQKYKSNRYALVMVDLHLSGQKKLEGIELMKWIRKQNPAIPLIAISGDGSIESIQEAYHFAVHDYIKKPFLPKELSLRVDRWVKSIPEKQAQKAHYGPLVYEPKTNEFYFRGKKMTLTKKNKSLLLLFVKNAESLISVEKIKRIVWGDHDPSLTSRNVRSNIQILRTALEPFGCQHWIKTVRGEGFALNSKPN